MEDAVQIGDVSDDARAVPASPVTPVADAAHAERTGVLDPYFVNQGVVRDSERSSRWNDAEPSAGWRCEGEKRQDHQQHGDEALDRPHQDSVAPGGLAQGKARFLMQELGNPQDSTVTVTLKQRDALLFAVGLNAYPINATPGELTKVTEALVLDHNLGEDAEEGTGRRWFHCSPTSRPSRPKRHRCKDCRRQQVLSTEFGSSQTRHSSKFYARPFCRGAGVTYSSVRRCS